VADSRVDALIKQAENLFGKRGGWLSYLQTVAENFRPERADFTSVRSLGTEFAAGTDSSYPFMVCRDLGDAFNAMLRPNEKEWFYTTTTRPERIDQAGRRWLEWARGTQKRAMYDRASLFTRATKEGDHDFAAFGQCVISIEMNAARNGLLYRTWHLRDVAWCEGAEGQIDTVMRRWVMTAKALKEKFGDRANTPEINAVYNKDPYAEIKGLHIVIPAGNGYELSDGRKSRAPYVSVHICTDHKIVLEDEGSMDTIYVIPRWKTISESQYAYSPATVIALPDARLLQSVTYTLLEAGEKAVSPPMIAVKGAIRGDLDLRSNGVTWADAAYDERLGEVLRPVSSDKNQFPVGFNIQNDLKTSLTQAFYLDRLSLPPSEREMTAFEISHRIAEYIRRALPLFEPMEAEYNGQVCERTFEVMLRNGFFGALADMPQSLRGESITYRFDSPLRQAADQQKGQLLQGSIALTMATLQLDPNAGDVFDASTALRDALNGAGNPANWQRDEEVSAQMTEARKKQQQAAMAIQAAQGMGDAGKSLGEAGQAIQAAGQEQQAA
jgi:hypothetical protein